MEDPQGRCGELADFTRQAIVATFKKLLKERGNLTVKNITDICDISRNTFYYHYDSLPALLQSELVLWFADCRDNGAASLSECMAPFVRAITSHKTEILHICSSSYIEVYMKFTSSLVRETVMSCAGRLLAASGATPVQAQVMAMFCASYLRLVFSDWVGGGMVYDVTASIAALDGMLSRDRLAEMSDDDLRGLIDGLGKSLYL